MKAADEAEDKYLTIGSYVSLFVPGSHGFLTATQARATPLGPERLCSVDHLQSSTRSAASKDTTLISSQATPVKPSAGWHFATSPSAYCRWID